MKKISIAHYVRGLLGRRHRNAPPACCEAAQDPFALAAVQAMSLTELADLPFERPAARCPDR